MSEREIINFKYERLYAPMIEKINGCTILRVSLGR